MGNPSAASSFSQIPELNIELQEENWRLKQEINKLKATIREMHL